MAKSKRSYFYYISLTPVTIGVLSAALAVIPAQAQVKSAAKESGQLEEMVVTATKRAENVQTVPASITVLSAASLERAAIRSFDDLVNISPSITITKTTQPGNNVIQLRGVGTYSFSVAAESSVAVVVDDVPQTFQAASFTDLVDVQRVEVLRGPQSTLFGKSASAGVINVTTQPATKEFTASGSAMITDDRERRGTATVSGPLTDQIKYRLTANISDYEGNLYNLTTGKYADGSRGKTFRGRIDWTPGANWDISFTPHYNDTKSTCCVSGGAAVFLSPGLKYANVAAITQANAFKGITIGPDNTTFRNDVPPLANSHDTGAAVKASYDWNGYVISSITSYDFYHMKDQVDNDGLDLNFAAIPGGTPGAVNGSYYTGWFNVKTTTQELRVTSPASQSLRYVAGVYFANIDAANFLNRLTRATATTTGSGPALYQAQSGSKSYAAFGQATYDFLTSWTLIGGLRVNHEDINYVFSDYLAKKLYSGANGETATTGRGGLQYHITDSIMAFGTYSTGYKGQTYDLSSSFNAVVQARQPVKAETSTNEEMGIKSTLFNDHVILDVTAFNTKFNNYQLNSRDPVTNLTELVNVGVLRTRGFELDSYLNVVDNLSINLSGVYDEAKFLSYPNATCFSGQTAAQGCVSSLQNLSGKRLNNAPRWSFSAGGQYDIPLNGLPVDGFVTAAYRWKSKVIFNSNQDPDSVQSAVGIVNFGVGADDKNGRYKLTFFVNNVFDKHYALTIGRDGNWLSGGQTGDAIAWKPARDSSRYLGATLNFTY